MTQDYMGAFKAFLPDELRALLEDAGMRVLRCGGIGSLTSLCDAESLDRLREDAAVFEAFLDLCERYDREVLPDGPGTWHRAGLIAVAAPKAE
jgi:sugar phosphate isomerase/epimerase